MLRHGTDRSTTFIVVMKATAEEVTELQQKTGKSPAVLLFPGNRQFVPLHLADGLAAGELEEALFDAKQARWTATIALMRYR